MALIDISDDFVDKTKDIVLTSSQKHRAYNLLKYEFLAYNGVGLNIEKMIFDGLPVTDIEKIITDYYDDFDVKYTKIETKVDEKKGYVAVRVNFEGGVFELNFA